MITRSFSKIFALGGLRIGWGYSQLHNISKIYEFKKPFNVSRLSCIAGIESLKSKSWLKLNIQKNIINKNYTINNLKKIFFEIIDTKANFILLKFKNEKLANSYVNFLNKKKITVRSLTSYGLPNYIRMTIGTQSDMRKTVKISINLMFKNILIIGFGMIGSSIAKTVFKNNKSTNIYALDKSPSIKERLKKQNFHQLLV